MSWNEIDIGESNLHFHSLWKLSFHPPTVKNPRNILGPPFLTFGVHFICKAHRHHRGFECFLRFLSTLFFLPAVTFLTDSGAAFDRSCDLEQFHFLFFAQHLHDIHSDKSHGWQIMPKVLVCDMEWDDPPLGQRMDCWERRIVGRQVISVQ